MPVFPPIAESTCAKRVVGICIKSTPLKKVSAANPAKSPITPPPNAIIVSCLSKFFSIKKL